MEDYTPSEAWLAAKHEYYSKLRKGKKSKYHEKYSAPQLNNDLSRPLDFSIDQKLLKKEITDISHKYKKKLRKLEMRYSQELNSKDQSISELVSENKNLNAKLDELQLEILELNKQLNTAYKKLEI